MKPADAAFVRVLQKARKAQIAWLKAERAALDACTERYGKVSRNVVSDALAVVEGGDDNALQDLIDFNFEMESARFYKK